MLGHRPPATPLLHCLVLMLSFCVPAQPQSSRGSRRHLERHLGAHEAEGGPGSGWSHASLGAYTGGGGDGTTVQKLHEGSHRSMRAIRDWGSDLFLCLQVSGLGSCLLVGHSGGGAAETPPSPGLWARAWDEVEGAKPSAPTKWARDSRPSCFHCTASSQGDRILGRPAGLSHPACLELIPTLVLQAYNSTCSVYKCSIKGRVSVEIGLGEVEC